jgi:hypothetical protein
MRTRRRNYAINDENDEINTTTSTNTYQAQTLPLPNARKRITRKNINTLPIQRNEDVAIGTNSDDEDDNNEHIHDDTDIEINSENNDDEQPNLRNAVQQVDIQQPVTITTKDNSQVGKSAKAPSSCCGLIFRFLFYLFILGSISIVAVYYSLPSHSLSSLISSLVPLSLSRKPSFTSLYSQFPRLNESLNSLYPEIASRSLEDKAILSVSIVCIDDINDSEVHKERKRHYFAEFIKSLAPTISPSSTSRELLNVSDTDVDRKIRLYFSNKVGQVVLFENLPAIVNSDNLASIQQYIDDFDPAYPRTVYISTIYISSSEWEKHARDALKMETDAKTTTHSKVLTIVRSYLKQTAFIGKGFEEDLINPLISRLTKNILYDNTLLNLPV